MDDWLLEIPTIPLSKHPLIVSLLHLYCRIDNEIPSLLDMSLKVYQELIEKYPEWKRCWLIVPSRKKEYLSKNGKRIVLFCHKDFIKIAYREDSSCQLIVYDFKCPQCGQREIVPERSHTYLSFENGKTEERLRIHFWCGHVVEGVIDEKTRRVFF